MKYIEVTITTKDETIEEIIGILMSLGIEETVVDSYTTALEILEKKNEYEWDYVDENFLDLDKEPTITFYMEDTSANENLYGDIVSSIQNNKINDGENTGLISITKKIVDDEDWMNSYKEHFKTIDLTDTIVVKPSWEEEDEFNKKKILKLDPGMAFGTGDHATTSMCTVLMEKSGCLGKDILDIGTGSGILSIAADILGGKNILGIDIDPIAVEVAQANGEANGCKENVKFIQGDLTKGIDFVADLVVANLMAEVIIMLTKDIKKCLKNQGVFIVSGILTEKKDGVIDEMEREGFEIVEVMEKGEWVAIAAKCYE